MKSVKTFLSLRRLSVVVASSALAACGAGSDQAQGTLTGAQTAASLSTSLPGLITGPITTTVPPSTGGGTTSPASTPSVGITDIRFENTSATAAQTNVPVTFGQVFAQGNLLATDKLTGRLEDGTTVPLQVDVKATHADGSVRHAIISAVVPSIAPAKVRTMSLVKGGTAPTGTVTTDSLLRAGFSTSVHAQIGGVDYYASADDLLKTAKPTAWLNGPIATEWQVSAPLRTTSGAQHPHLSARFAIRWYAGVNKARVDVVVENDWAYEPSPQNFVYDASVIVGGKSVYTKAGLNHYHHARWRKLFWFNSSEPQVDVKLNTNYLIDSKAVPNYDRSIKVAESALATMQKNWTGALTEPMNVGFANAYMPGTGGRQEIGMLPAWSASYLLSMDKRAHMVTLGNGDLAGTWSAHYRDKQTGQPISLLDFPYMTIYGQASDTRNPATKQYESFPVCSSTSCKTPYTHDAAHQPSFAYLPYLVSGDYYYLEELQFWSMWNQFSSNPGYRQNSKGLLQQEQVRAQAWSLRTLAEAAYITPDKDRLKSHFIQILNNNLDWYNATYSDNASANKLGAIVTNSAFAYLGGTGIAPWQDDFFTAAVGHTNELGFAKATPLLKWKAQYAVFRMTSSEMCWISAGMYEMKVRDTMTSAIYNSIGQAYHASIAGNITSLKCASAEMAAAFGLKAGQMTGYSDSAEGYPSNLQPALAYAADVMGTAGKTAWATFAKRVVQPDYTAEPQFNIVPR